jgi:hypothetical protein
MRGTSTGCSGRFIRGLCFQSLLLMSMNIAGFCRFAVAVAVVATSIVIEPCFTFAQPVNDRCSGATPMALDTVYTVNTATATSTGDPTTACSQPLGKGVWYSFTAPRNGMLTLSTCGSDFDTILQVYTGDCGSLTWVTCADDGGPDCTGKQASASFLVSTGATYLIVVGGYAGASGNLRIMASMPIPANDQCSGAMPLLAGTTYTVNTANATANNDPVPLCARQFGNGVWFSFTPTNNDEVTISTCGSDLDTVMQVYTGICGALSPFTCNDDNGPACGGNNASVRFAGSAGTTYLILVGGFYGTLKSGNIRIVAAEGEATNDTCNSAIAMAAGLTYTLNTANATSGEDEAPICQPSFGNGVWYNFTPAANGIVTISTCGSDFDTALQIFSGDCGSLLPVVDGCNSDNGPTCLGNQASVSFSGSAGVPYQILVGGSNNATGNLMIKANVSPSLTNDNCSGAIAMTVGVTYTETTTNATSGGDPIPTCQTNFAKGVWYRFTPVNSGIVTVTTCGSDFDTVLQVFTGTCGSLTTVIDGCNNDHGPSCANSRASVSFAASASTPYLILVGGRGGATGNLNIRATLAPVLANDQCSGAIPITDRVIYTVNTTTATSVGDPLPGCHTNFSKGVWFKLTPLTSDGITMSTCGSDFNTVLQVYAGTCGSLIPISYACSDGDSDCPGNATLGLDAVGGVTYFILAGGASGATGNLKISATAVRPSNDQCFSAIPMVVGSNYTVNTSYASSTNDPPPGCQPNFGHGVWYTFTPRINLPVTISTCGSDFDTVVQIFSGDCSSLVRVACNDGNGPACSGNRASVTFNGVANKQYFILAGGRAGVSGNLSTVASVPPPPNDFCGQAIAMTEGVTYSANTFYATSTDDPVPICRTNFGKGVWYSFTSPTTAFITISTCGSDFDTVMQVYSGTCGALSPEGCNDDNGPACGTNQASVHFLASAGAHYFILVGGFAGAAGNLKATAAVLTPANDQCAGAIAMAEGTPYGVNTVNASSTGDPKPVCQPGFGNGVWYSFTPTLSGVLQLSTCGSDFDTVIQVYTGATCGALTPLAGGCNDDAGPVCESVTGSLRFNATAGTKYWILAGGYGGAVGNLELTANVLPPIVLVRQGTNIVISWRTNGLAAYYLESATSLSPPVFWNYTGPWPSISGSNYVVTNPISGPVRFYRLIK